MKLEKLVRVKTGKLDANAANEGGKYPFFTCSRETLFIDECAFDCECVLLAGNGELNVKYYNGKFNAYQRTYVIESVDKNKLDNRYLYYFFEKYLENLKNSAIGGVIKYIKLNNITDADINFFPIEKQKKIVNELDFLNVLLDKQKNKLILLDELIKSRFIEMFGDSYESAKYPVISLGKYMTTLVDFNANGGYEKLDSNVIMYDEPNYAWMVRTTDLESKNYKEVKYIDEKAYELLSKSKIFGEELIMSKIGSAGKIYLMPKIEKPASLGRNAFMMRFDKTKVNMIYLYHMLSTNFGTNDIISRIRGAVTKTITKNETRNIRYINAPINLQNEFAIFVERIDKSKLIVQNQINLLEDLYNKKLEEYFGD